MNLIIVEDEIRLRTSIAENIAWHELDVVVAGMAGNGAEAIELFARVKPEIVLMDIRMPGMDGLTLSSKLLEMAPGTKIVILSGHDSFEYAQKAIELGVCQYLLKPAGDKQIAGAVAAAAEQHRKELEALHKQEEVATRWMEHLPRLQQMFLQNWIEGRYADWELESRSKKLQLELAEGGSYIAVVVDMDPLPREETRFSEKDRSLLAFSLNMIAHEFLHGEAVWVFQDAHEHTVLLFYALPRETQKELYFRVNTAASKLLDAVKECLKLTASAGVGEYATAGNQAPRSYFSARLALAERMVSGHHIVIPYRNQDPERVEVASGADPVRVLKSALDVGDEAKAKRAYHELLEQGLFKAANTESVKEQILHLSGVFFRMIHLRGWSVKQVAGDDYETFHRLETLQSKEQVQLLFERLIERMIRHVNERSLTGSQQLVQEILLHIEKEITGDLSLHQIALRFYVNPSYLSRIFKREIGKPFSVYLFERKMEHARRMLSEGMKVYDTAELLGYADVSYFIRVFHKHWGVTPGEVKKS